MNCVLVPDENIKLAAKMMIEIIEDVSYCMNGDCCKEDFRHIYNVLMKIDDLLYLEDYR